MWRSCVPFILISQRFLEFSLPFLHLLRHRTVALNKTLCSFATIWTLDKQKCTMSIVPTWSSSTLIWAHHGLPATPCGARPTTRAGVPLGQRLLNLFFFFFWLWPTLKNTFFTATRYICVCCYCVVLLIFSIIVVYITVIRTMRLTLWPGSCLLFINGQKMYIGGIIFSLLD